MTVSAATLFVQSHQSWWQLAGLDTLVHEEPVNWLAPLEVPVAEPVPPLLAERTAEPKVAPALAPAPGVQKPLAPLVMPDDLNAFQAWLASDPAVPGTQWHTQRVLPAGSAAAPLMVLALTPEMADHDVGALFSGEAGRLLDAMLRAIGLLRADCYLASLALTRPPGGRIDAADMATLTPLLWHHVKQARPERLLLLGTDLAQIVAHTDLAAARGKLLSVNHDGRTMAAAAIQHPMLLLDRPARKAAAWDSLKLLKQ